MQLTKLLVLTVNSVCCEYCEPFEIQIFKILVTFFEAVSILSANATRFQIIEKVIMVQKHSLMNILYR